MTRCRLEILIGECKENSKPEEKFERRRPGKSAEDQILGGQERVRDWGYPY